MRWDEEEKADSLAGSGLVACGHLWPALCAKTAKKRDAWFAAGAPSRGSLAANPKYWVGTSGQ